MTIDERLGALTMNRELQAHEGEAQRLRIDRMVESIDKIVGSIDTLKGLVDQDAENIRALARIAEIHDRRIGTLEGGH